MLARQGTRLLFLGCVALQLALDDPAAVSTLALLEPGLMVGESAQGYREALQWGVRRYREVGAAVTVDEFLQARWPGYRAMLGTVLPGAFDQAVADADTWFEREVPGQLEWRFGEAEAAAGRAEARATVEAVAGSIRDPALRRSFLGAEPVQCVLAGA